jgi:hypothetical protein
VALLVNSARHAALVARALSVTPTVSSRSTR